MNNPTDLPRFLTVVAYFFLAGLSAYLLAHLLAIGWSLLDSPGRQWLAESNAIAAELWGDIEQMQERMRELRDLSRDEHRVRKAWNLGDELTALRNEGPSNGLLSWVQARCFQPSEPLRAALDAAESAEADAPQAAGEDVLDDQLSRWQVRLSVPMTAGPLAGAAPTMSGAMSFLRALSDQALEGIATPPMTHINDCLLTTYVGCAIAAIAVVGLALVAGIHRHSRRDLREAVSRVITMYRHWQRAAQDAANALAPLKEAHYADTNS